VINVLELPTYKKRVRKVSEQAESESRRLWYNVTRALKMGDIDSATKYKQTVRSVPLSVSLRTCGGVSVHTGIFHVLCRRISAV